MDVMNSSCFGILFADMLYNLLLQVCTMFSGKKKLTDQSQTSLYNRRFSIEMLYIQHFWTVKVVDPLMKIADHIDLLSK